MFEWTNPCNPDCNKPIPITAVGVSFYNHKTELKDWIFNGGGFFCTDQNDVSYDIPVAEPWTNEGNVWWTWLPDELQVESNELPSDYPDIGYGHYPENLEIITDPWIFSTPNEIDITKVDKSECHGRFTNYPGYTALVRDKSDGDILEIYREYGSGVVVLSHVEYETADPWDVDYIENEINFVKPDRKDINLKLYIEDAIAGRRVGSPPVANKAPGDMIHIVAVVVNKEETSQTVDVELSVPPEFGNPEKVIIRDDFSPQSKIKEIEPGALSVEVMNLESGKKIQVVWRFKILDSASPQSTIVGAEAKVGNVLCAADTGGLHIVDNVDAIIVTNRYLLYDKYDDDDVDSLLTYLYQISAWGNTISKKNCIVYYVDHYDEDLEDWDQDVEYPDFWHPGRNPNEVANKIDELIEDWDRKTTPPYLMIVGGDDVIPFYRMKDPVEVRGEEEIYEKDWGFADKQSSNPTFKTYGNGYFFTDNTYATSGNNWDHGELGISLGRIVGYDALDIKKLIENGCTKKSPAGRAVVASICNWDMGTKGKPYSNIPEDLRNRGFDVKNDGIPVSETPSTVDNDEWSENDLQNAVALGADIIIMGAHAEHTTSIICNENWWFRGTEISTRWDNNGQISNYHPLIYVGGCHGGCPVPAHEGITQGNLVYGLIQHNALAYIGATGFSYGSTGDYDGGGNAELFMQYFINKAFKNTGESHKIGLALRAAKVFYNDYVPGGNNWGAEDRKTVTEYILYGVPWSRISYPQGDSTSSSYASRFTSAASEDNLTISISDPIGMGNNTFKRIIDVNVSGYQVHKEDVYDIFTISGTSLSFNTMKPVLPVAKIRFSLPKEALIQDLSIIDNVSSIIGVYNVPSIEPGSWSDPGGYTNQSDVIGWYPVPPYSMDYSNYESSTFITIETAPIQYNTTSKEVRLYNYTKLELTYQTPIIAAITDFSPEKTEYTSGEMINASSTMENVGSDALTGLQVNLQLKDPYGQVKALGLSSTLDVASGESKTVYATLNQNLPHGSYLAEMILINSTGDALGSSFEYIYIRSGGIVDFFLPAEVESGDDITANITFKNDNTTSVTATGVVYIYDPHDIEIAELYSAPTDIAGNSTGIMNVTWSTAGREIGNYTASAVVFVGEEAFGPVYRDFKIKQKPILSTDIPNVELVSADPTVTSINVTSLDLSEINETHKPAGVVVSKSAYMINSTGAGNFTLRFTNITNANTIIAYKINATSQWIELDTTTTIDTVTFTMEVGDPPVVFASGSFTTSIDLYTGWNIISAPSNLTSWQLGNESVVDDPLNVTPTNSLTSIYRYNTTSGLFDKCDHIDDWGWSPATGSENFTMLEPGKGYWVWAKSNCNLTFTGTAPSDLDIALVSDWNLIGWYSTEAALPGQESVVGNPLNVTPENSLSSIYRYNATTAEFDKCDRLGDWGWWPATGSQSFSDLEPGRGYWVRAKNACVWQHVV